MTLSDSEWPPWRTRRLLDLMELKAQGMTDEEAGKALTKPISRRTVSRELNSEEATKLGNMMATNAASMVWPLVRRQMRQIERSGLTSGQQANYRGQLIKTLVSLVPKRIETKSDVTLDTKTYNILLSDVGAPNWEEVKKEGEEDEPSEDDKDPAGQTPDP